MAKLNKNIFTVCVSENGSNRIYSAGRFFEVNEDKASIVNPTQLENTLAWALENFEVTSEGFHFFYDLNAKSIKHFVSTISEDFQNDILSKAVEAGDEIKNLNEQLATLSILKRQHALKNEEAAVNEANMMSSVIQNKIQELKKSAVYVKYTYVAEENKAYINNTQTVVDNFAETAFATGHIDYKNKPLLHAFEAAAKNFKNYKNVENLIEAIDDNIVTTTLRVENNAYVYRINRDTNISSFNQYSPVKAIEYVAENTGADLSFLFEDILEAKKDIKAKINARLEETYELIAFLKDQKNILADANKNIAEIKEADNLISLEIANFEKIARILESDELTKNDGYMDAIIAVEYEGIPKDSEIKVDALDYTTAAKDDMITIVANGKTSKVVKYHVNLEAKDSI